MRFDQFDKCLGLELKSLTDTTFSRRSCLLSRKGNALSIVSTSETSGPLTHVLSDVARDYPVALCLSGKGVLHRLVSSKDNIDNLAAFTAAFPGLQSDDFYYQVFRDEEKSFVSIVRKDIVDHMLQLLTKAGIQLFSITLGPAVTSHIWSQLNVYGERIIFDCHAFELSTKKALINYNYSVDVKSEFGLKIAEESVKEEVIIAYAAAFQLILNNRLDQIDANVVEVKANLGKFLEKRNLQVQGLTALFTIFIALLVSFLVFFHYNSANASLRTTLGQISSEANHIDALAQRIKDNSTLIEDYLKWNGGYNYGYLVNEIGSSLTRRLVLTKVSINEMPSDMDQDNKSSIRILGSTDDLNAVNNWMFILNDKKWVKKVSLIKYQKEPDTESYSFSLDLIY